MAVTTTSLLAQPWYPDLIADMNKAFYVENKMFQWFQRVQWQNSGAVQVHFDVGATTNNATSVAEDEVLPSPNSGVQATGTFSATTYAVTAAITMEAQMEGARGLVEKEMMDRTNELTNTVNSALASALETSIGTAAYGGLTRATYAAALSRAGAGTHGGTEATAGVDALIEALYTPTVGGRPAVQLQDIVQFWGSTSFFDFKALTAPSTTYTQDPSGGFNSMGLYDFLYNGTRVVHNPAGTALTACLGDPRTVKIYEIQPFTVKPIATSNLTDRYAISWRGVLVNSRPSAWAIYTNS